MVPLAVVVAEDVPVTVPALCTAALGIAAAAIVVAAGTGASAAPAVEAATEMPHQTVDQILLLPGLRQLKSGAQFLQLGDGLHARGQRNQMQRESKASGKGHGWAARTLTRVQRDSGNTCVCHGAGNYHQGSSQLSRSS
jgi:hypothetical protein